MIGVNVDVTRSRQTENAIRSESRKLSILNRSGAEVAAELDLDRIVEIVTDACTELVGAQFGSFFYNVIDDKGESYMLYALSGVSREAFSKFPMPRATEVFEPTFKGEGVVRSDDILLDPRYGKSGPHLRHAERPSAGQELSRRSGDFAIRRGDRRAFLRPRRAGDVQVRT